MGDSRNSAAAGAAAALAAVAGYAVCTAAGVGPPETASAGRMNLAPLRRRRGSANVAESEAPSDEATITALFGTVKERAAVVIDGLES
eukprot:COSAG05_NODE_10614_length_555_cov_3.111842_1_plen_87_part_10